MIDRIWEEISYSKLKHNLDIIKKYAKSKSIICMVKDNAYGHGAVNISKFLSDDENVDAFAVATIRGADELKKHGITKDIIIISHISKCFYKEAIENDYVMTISSYDQALDLDDQAKALGKLSRVEIAIDTGMGRIGFRGEDEAIDGIKKISDLKNVVIRGIFSHFSVVDSDDENNIEYTNIQEKKFSDIVDRLRKEGIDIPNTSISNSAAILSGRGEKFSTIRPGIILYGIAPNDLFDKYDLKPIMSLKSKIIHIKEVDKNTSISYGRTYIADKTMKIATISCGYGDGYPRTASNKSYVIINDKLCKVIGRVTMDMMMVDVTGVDCKIEDDVILIGESENVKYTLKDLCDASGEFVYEILTRINHRVERIYI